MLCCIGDLVEDVVARVTSDIAHGTDTVAEIRRRQGGSAANVAVAAAEAGADVRFIGKVGSDTAGAALIAQLEDRGVEPSVERGGRTGTIVVLVDATGERTMLTDTGSAVDLGHIEDTRLEGVEWLHVPAYSLVKGQIAVSTIGAIERVSARGGTVSIDASSIAIIKDFGVARFVSMLADLGPRFVLCNVDEAALLGVGDGPGLDGVDFTIVKDGPREARVLAASGVVASAPAISLDNVRDTTGAGDAFAAGFIVAMMDGRSLDEALVNGHAVAASTLSRLSP